MQSVRDVEKAKTAGDDEGVAMRDADEATRDARETGAAETSAVHERPRADDSGPYHAPKAGKKPSSRFVALARGVYVGFMLLQLVFIGVFLLVGPWWALRGGLPGAVLLLAGLGLFFDFRGLDVLLERAPAAVRRGCMRVAVASHLVAIGWALVLMLRPIDPAWTLLPDSENWSDPIVAFAGDDGFVVHTGGGRVWGRTVDGWRDLGEPPGGRSWEFLAGSDGALWSAPRGTPRLDRRDPATGQWRSLGRPDGELKSLAVGEGELLVTVGGALHRLDMAEGTWSKEQSLAGRVEQAALGGGTAVALGGSWWSRGGTGAWVESPRPEGLSWYYPAVGGGGWRYAWCSGMWSSDLRVAPPGQPFAPRTPPTPDLRVVVPHPESGARVVAGSWGQGVWASDDGGATWSALGLERVQVRSLAVDWRRSVVCAASSNTIWNRGVFCRDLPHGQPSGAATTTGSP